MENQAHFMYSVEGASSINRVKSDDALCFALICVQTYGATSCAITTGSLYSSALSACCMTTRNVTTFFGLETSTTLGLHWLIENTLTPAWSFLLFLLIFIFSSNLSFG